MCDQISPYLLYYIILSPMYMQAQKKTTFEEKEYKFYIESVSKG